jgi:hypothetical protein
MQDGAEKIASEQDRKEQESLVQKILTSTRFENASTMRDIFIYLFKNTHRFVSRNELALEVYKANAKDTQLSVANSAAERCGALREALKEFVEGPGTNEPWRCELLPGIRGQGYRLKFVKRDTSPTELFWCPHLEAPNRIVVVCNSHLFFHDPEQNSSFRFYDTNAEGDAEEALALLRKLHPKAYKKGLLPIRFYLSSGEVNAYAHLQSWFHTHAGVLIPRRVSRDVQAREILNSSPILLGRPDANSFIKRILNSPEASHLAYRFHKPLGAVKINAPRKDEIKALSRFPLSSGGVLGPVPNWEVVFGIVTRLPNPSGYGSVTIISADYYATVIAQIAAALTSDEQASRLLAQMNWPAGKSLPESFEMLFAVRLSPGNMEGEGHAELMAWRTPFTEC